MDETLTIKEAAQFLKMHPETLRRQAALHAIDGVKAGRSWVFLKEDLKAYLRNCYKKKPTKDKITGKKTWHSTNQVNIGELELPLRMEEEYNAALGRKTKSKPSSFTIK